MNEIPRRWELPVRSQEFLHGPVLDLARGTLRLRYDYETESGGYAWQELRFTGVMGVRFTGDLLCTPEMCASLDRLEEVAHSTWLAGLEHPQRDLDPMLRHVRIYFDSLGCYDILAARAELPEWPSDAADPPSRRLG